MSRRDTAIWQLSKSENSVPGSRSVDFINSASVLKCTTPFYFWCFVFRGSEGFTPARLHSLEKAADSLTWEGRTFSKTKLKHACPLAQETAEKDSKKSPKKKAFSISSESGLSLQKALAKKRSKGSSLKGKGKPACRVH